MYTQDLNCLALSRRQHGWSIPIRRATRKLKITLTLAVIVCSPLLYAQEEDRCNDVLKPWVKDTIDFNQKGTFASVVQNWACSQSKGSNRDAMKTSGSAGLTLDGIPAAFGGDLSGSKEAEWFEQHCDAKTEALTDSQAQTIVATRVPPDGIKEWGDCMRRKPSQSSVVTISGTLSGADIAQLTIHWTPNGNNTTAPIVSDFIHFNASCGPSFKRDTVIRGTSTGVVCTRTKSGVVMIFGLNTKNQGSTKFLPFSPKATTAPLVDDIHGRDGREGKLFTVTFSETESDPVAGFGEGNNAGWLHGGSSINGTYKFVGGVGTWKMAGAFYQKSPVKMVYDSFRCGPTAADWAPCKEAISPNNHRLLLYGTVLRFDDSGWVFYPVNAIEPIGYITVPPSRSQTSLEVR